MATFFSGVQVGYWVSQSNRLIGTLTGTVSRNGNTISLTNLVISIYATQGGSGSDNFTFTVGGVSTGFRIYPSSNSYALNSVSFSVGANDTSSSVSWSSSDGYGGSFTVNFISNVSASNVVPGIESFSATVSVAGWGADATSTRHRELQCWTYNATQFVMPRRYAAVSGDILSGTITVDNNSYDDGGLNITGNTRYTLGAYAYNGTTNTNSQRVGDYVTLAYKDTLTLNSATSNSLTIDYSVPSDGGFYNKTLEYSIDNGTTWTAYDSISGGSAKTGTFTITGLSASTSYTIKSRVITTSGVTNNDDLVASTIGIEQPTISANNATYQQNNITYGVSSFSGGSDPAIYLYGGISSAPTTVLDSQTTTGDQSYAHSGLTGNTAYYYRARAKATLNGSVVWSDYSTEIQVVTICQPPSITSMAVVEYESLSTVKVRTVVDVLADGGFYNKDLSYRYKVGSGSFSNWVVATSFSGGSAQTYNIDIANVPVNTEITVEVRIVSTAGTTTSATRTITTSGTHQGPTGFDFVLRDYNSSVQNIFSGISGYVNPVFVQGKSRAEVVIPRATAGVASDGASIVEYKANIQSENKSITIPFVSGTSEMYGTFVDPTPEYRSTDFPSNLLSVDVDVYDSLSSFTRVSKNVLSLSYEEPTLNIEAERLSTLGSVLLNFSGSYARLQDNSLNSGNNINLANILYRLLDFDGTVLQDWTAVSSFNENVNENYPFLEDFAGSVTLNNVPYLTALTIQVKIQDKLSEKISQVTLAVWDTDKIIYPAEYDIELWDWKTNTFVADLSYLVVGDLNITWELNDVEEVNFEIDLVEFEKKCEEMGVNSEDLLKPYSHDIRIRRNGEYILGCQLVMVDIRISNNPPSKILIRGTGFLNLFKDQYILNEAWSGYTYAQIARKLVEAAQKPDCLIKNPTCDIDISYWLASSGTISYNTGAHSGDGCISGSRSGTGWITYGTQMNIDSGQLASIDVWVKGKSGDICYVREREYVTQYINQQSITQITLDGSWQHIQVADYTTFYENGYIVFETSRTDSSTLFLVDDCYVYATSDESSLCNMNVVLGVDNASAYQNNNRQVNYELQNIKDALIDLTSMEDDNFEFEFLPDRTFNVYTRKGSDKLDLEIGYPGNIDSLTVTRSASDLANKVIAIGSGIGDERLQVQVSNSPSRRLYGTRESITTDSNISLRSTLLSKAVGNLYDRKNPSNLPQIVIRDGSINPSNVQTGDIILVEVRGEKYIESVTGEYRIIKIDFSLSEDDVESMTLTVEPPLQRPQKKMVRYIRESLNGNSANNYNHWVEIQALMLVGNEYVNVALNKTVTYNGEVQNATRITDGVVSTASGCYTDGLAPGTVTIDLGGEYPIDYIRVWHFWEDNRQYKDSVLSVGISLPDGPTGNEPLDEVLWEYTGFGYAETAQGKRSKWLQEESILEG